MKTILKHYPNSVSLSQLESKLISELEKHGFVPEKTIWGTSICSDEVNNTFNVLNRCFAGAGPFRFGGISGLPFTGKTGMLAFESHIPDDGDAFILYGPHIGISKDGSIGEIRREGQKINTTCCGSLIAGLSAIRLGFEPGDYQSTDYQQLKVQELIYSAKNKVEQSELPIKEVTEIALSEAHRQLMEIIELTKESLKGHKLFLIGGIVINTDWDVEDYFEIRGTELFKF
tara:strand:- start:1883 stop:2572 length:690 start_codon:yes stop_codon:yes gene_type:complete